MEAAVIPATAAAAPAISVANTDMAVSLTDVEAQHISQLLQQHHNNRRRVAQALNISERTLYRKLKKFNLT